ncbi:MAG: pyruvate formate-lyase [Clostridia bacterium]|nr:pyruvate formate-lyase [Clostridia bacterium]
MNDQIRKHLQWIEERQHRKLRRNLMPDEWQRICDEIRDPSKPMAERVTRRLELFLEMEQPVWMEHTHIQGLRTIIEFPDIYAPGEMDEIKTRHFVHEKGKVTNIACDYGTVLTEGLEGRRARLHAGLEQEDEAAKAFAAYTDRTLDAVEQFADRYAQLYEAHGDMARAQALSRAIRYGAQTMEEAMQCFRMIHFSFWAADNYHNTVGRFDQYMYPFYQKDIASGLLDEESALSLIEDFFLSFNVDSDLYYSLQWGDNGQSLMLGGCKRDGSSAVNELTTLAMKASLAIRQIDPKLNLRVDKNTPLALYELGTQLTRMGMGFPQYANDDVVIPGLLRWGYDIEDARDYTVAACWEYIVPNVSMDIVNIDAMPMAEVAHGVISECLPYASTFEDLLQEISCRLHNRALKMVQKHACLYMEPSPMASILMRGFLEAKRDISEGGKYNNYGVHGTGFSCAVDQLAAVRRFVFEEGSVSREELLEALGANFEGHEQLRHRLRTEAPKIGRDEEARMLGNRLLKMFAEALDGLHNERGGCYRAGTGSAMYYLWHSRELPATADGRDAGQPLPANFSPALFITRTGPLSVLRGFALSALPLAVNGGPMTLELHDTVFKAEDSVEKVARLVQSFMLQGGHQLQLNAVNREKMKKAQEHPEEYGDLIVRVWGWSGHFVELDKAYQDQIIARTEFGI